MKLNMDGKPLVTLRILCYNNVNKLDQAIKRLTRQDYPNIELLISDDASKNTTKAQLEEIAKKYESHFKHIIVNRNEVNLGIVKNINKTIQLASGDIICGAPVDDHYADDHTISRVVEYFLNHPQALVVITRRLDETDGVIRPSKKVFHMLQTDQKKYEKMMMRITPQISSAGSFCKKELFERYGTYPETFKMVEDAPFFCNLILNGIQIDCIDKVTFIHAKGGVSDPHAKPNPLWLKDRYHIFSQVLYPASLKHDWFTRRCVRFHMQRTKEQSKLLKYLYFLLYIDVVIYNGIFFLPELLSRKTREADLP
ncbi:MAG: glycosyltransferase [Clostridia bacterium]|nr:glycosyltransferase [Clostridia bacterium]